MWARHGPGATAAAIAAPVVFQRRCPGAALAPSAGSSAPCRAASSSRRALNCGDTPSNGAPRQHCLGTISRYGLDIGPQGPGTLTWDVVSPSGAAGPGALSLEHAP